MAVSSRAVSVTTTATRLDSGSDAEDRVYGSSLSFYNESAVTVYLGGSDVTTANGVPVPADSWSPGLDLYLTTDDAVYGIVAAGSAEVRVLETGVA